jgi:nitrite reductase/ring-hydroxylating ferredoxin subunit/uncharacterized membrane protein
MANREAQDLDDPARRLRALTEQLGADARIDRLAAPLTKVAEALTRRDDVKRALSGSWLGHRLHPMLTDVPIGAWTSASLLDLMGGRAGRRVARRLVGLGIVASAPTIASGLSDWHDTHAEDRRIGVVHATANATALVCQLASWRARGKGHRGRGVLLSGLGLGALTVGGYLGGHLVFSRRVGVDADVPVVDLRTFRTVGRLDDFVEGVPRRVEIDGAPIVVVRRGETAHALAAVCSHAGGPLDEGRVDGNVIECPWHGSEFSLADGSVRRGPAGAPQPCYAARVREGFVEVRGPVVTEPIERIRSNLASSG